LVLRLLAVVVLYAFLILVITIIWRDLRAARARFEGPELSAPGREMAAPPGRLRVVAGREAVSGPDDVIALQTSVTLGRAPDNHIALSDVHVSSYHARLDRRDGEWWLSDMGSRNGTRLNDVPIGKPAPLVDGDVIGIGRVELKLEIGNHS
jgi:pSer/pThr/pTyr-binding forkhead associated (FHA) protein